jgi:SPP1 gp7 family putative phage head morphogenesis protein
MTHDHDPGRACCSIGNVPLEAAVSGDDDDDRPVATSDITDLRRARQRARATIRDLADVIIDFLSMRQLEQTLGDGPQSAQDLNRLISRTASDHIQRELLDWLDERKRITMGRAARAAFDTMQSALPGDVNRDDLVGSDGFTNADAGLLRQLRQIDAGLLTDDDGDSLASEIGDEVTRQLRVGFRKDEPIRDHRDDKTDLATRVDMALNGPDYEQSKKQEAGITGQSKRTKGELIAHDSIQDAYNAQARRRYLQNGFRFVVYDATLDTRTTDLCRRMDGEVIDILENPHLVPPNHPYCRSGIRPVLDPDREAIREADIADGFLQDIWSTESYRPTVQDDDAFQPTAITRRLGQAG